MLCPICRADLQSADYEIRADGKTYCRYCGSVLDKACASTSVKISVEIEDTNSRLEPEIEAIEEVKPKRRSRK